jgi:hypothetical protein
VIIDVDTEIYLEITRCTEFESCRTKEEIDRAMLDGVFTLPIMEKNFVDNADFDNPVKSYVEGLWS